MNAFVTEAAAPAVDHATVTTPQDERNALGMRVIIFFKLLKAPLMFGLAILFTAFPHATSHWVHHLAIELSAGGHWLAKLGDWLTEHGETSLKGAKWVAWADGTITAVEGFLLLTGRVWGEWLVVASVGSLVPVEAWSIGHRPSLVKGGVMLFNLIMVGYLVQRRLRASAHHRAAVKAAEQPAPPPAG